MVIGGVDRDDSISVFNVAFRQVGMVEIVNYFNCVIEGFILNGGAVFGDIRVDGGINVRETKVVT